MTASSSFDAVLPQSRLYDTLAQHGSGTIQKYLTIFGSPAPNRLLESSSAEAPMVDISTSLSRHLEGLITTPNQVESNGKMLETRLLEGLEENTKQKNAVCISHHLFTVLAQIIGMNPPGCFNYASLTGLAKRHDLMWLVEMHCSVPPLNKRPCVTGLPQAELDMTVELITECVRQVPRRWELS